MKKKSDFLEEMKNSEQFLNKVQHIVNLVK